MTDISRDAISDRREKVLQTLLLSTTVPFREGGGAVFPDGYPLTGYRLDQSQFERYHAECGNAVTRDAVARLVRDMRWIFLLSMLGRLLSFAAMNFLAMSPYFHSDLDSLLPTLAAIMVAVLAITSIVLINNRIMVFSRRFKSAPKVNRHAYLRERLLGALVARSNGPLFLHASVIVALGFTAVLAHTGIISPRPELFTVLFVVPMALWAAWRVNLLITYWRFRLAHGRAPQLADLQPV
jgi:hypothetical protein